MPTGATTAARAAAWWRGAVIYQVYIRSFADGNGDGIGDIAGLRSRLPYLADLGVDAIWINPWYPSPMADGGYDIADYRAVDPVFGTIEEAEAMVREAHAVGLRPHGTGPRRLRTPTGASPLGPPRGPRDLPCMARDRRRIDPPRMFVAEAWVDTQERLAQYVRSDELHTAFNFDFLHAPWRAATLRSAIDTTLVEHAAVGAPPTWVLSNHDVARHVSRYAREQRYGSGYNVDDLLGRPADYVAGHRRARAAALLMLALPGGAYVYQGEELGLPEVEDLPAEVLTDLAWERSGHTVRGRDGCRVPIPWSGNAPPFGFSPDGSAEPWLPQPPIWRDHSVAALDADPTSILNLYRTALRLRGDHPALGDGTLQWRDAPPDALVFARQPGLVCAVNFAPAPLALPHFGRVLISSGPLTEHGEIPQDTAVWLETAP